MNKIERIARELCAIRGIDPDESVSYGVDSDGSGFTPDILLYSLAWTRLTREIESHLQLVEAINKGDL